MLLSFASKSVLCTNTFHKSFSKIDIEESQRQQAEQVDGVPAPTTGEKVVLAPEDGETESRHHILVEQTADSHASHGREETVHVPGACQQEEHQPVE